MCTSEYIDLTNLKIKIWACWNNSRLACWFEREKNIPYYGWNELMSFHQSILFDFTQDSELKPPFGILLWHNIFRVAIVINIFNGIMTSNLGDTLPKSSSIETYITTREHTLFLYQKIFQIFPQLNYKAPEWKTQNFWFSHRQTIIENFLILNLIGECLSGIIQFTLIRLKRKKSRLRIGRVSMKIMRSYAPLFSVSNLPYTLFTRTSTKNNLNFVFCNIKVCNTQKW